MRRSPALALVASAVSAVAQGSYRSCNTITTDQIMAMGNNSLFTRWRPTSHVIAPAGWQNDPCGAMYDPTRGEYHIFYQWHPEHINWGNISWGHAISKDMISWTDVTGWQGYDALALGPTGNGSYNGLGIFSGTAQPVNLQGEQDGTLLAFYTSVSYLQTSWAIPYHPYTETQSLASSTDAGVTWENYAGNPVINATTETSPMYWNITGFRDPFLEASPALDNILGVSEPHYYAVFGSGIKGVGPRIPLWTAPASDLTMWSFLGALWEPADNTTLGPVLSTAANLHYFINMGTEGGNVSFHESAHWALWNEGIVSRRENGSAQFTPIADGAGDWGLSYALTSFNDTKNNRRLQWTWTPGDIVADGGLFSANQQGFQGSLSLPRELFVHEVSGVVNSNNGALTTNRESVLTQNANGMYVAQALGVRPAPDVVAGLRKGAKYSSEPADTFNATEKLNEAGSQHMEISATAISSRGAFGLQVAMSPNGEEYTTIYYEPVNSTLVVDRSHSTLIEGFNNASVVGYFYPYTVTSSAQTYNRSWRGPGFGSDNSWSPYGHGSSQDDAPAVEPITMDVFLDGSLLEIYINERFALATRIYRSMICSTGAGVWIGEGASATFSMIETYVGLAKVWPERPADTSSKLVWDTPAETNDYVWWSGN